MPPAIPTLVSVLLGLLWGLSVFGGWGVEAFCPTAASPAECADRLATVAAFSSVIALFAASATAAAWWTRKEELLGVAVLAWVAAEAALFLGGVIAQ
ncbi:hypothetical protein Pth03_68760 [Planotetraspora thailandica]|uniref:Uncharacterized protein n=1 Tax=Planotetraspora thailandica TaxID=487172 RepID=A0A8J4DEN8_9ACTN|nr:hypothetical protein [Planotetraspora thailandica]GII58487.1 hypothetical protein Pth03_68760 [Planotetraspora thailandica]